MPLRYILIFTAIGTVLSFLGVLGFVFLLSPVDLPWWTLLVFYLFVFLTTAGLFTVIGTVVRVRVLKAEVPLRQLTRSARQGALLGLLGVAGLVLAHIQFLTTWSLVLLVLALACLELFFLTSRSRAT